jgi:purine-binding chemotaxis protein CheW
MRALLLRVGEDAYAVPIERAREVVTAAVTPLPSAPASVLGVCNVRGEIIPVFDSGVLLGLGPMAGLDAIAVIETSLGPAGLAMTGLGEAVELGDPVALTETPGTAGAFAVGSSLAVLVDVEELFALVGSV